ncbi:IPT/TIG domain-containing protein [Candidatus Gottesmanbacteria bacterium]|nr:IPT/TIG domain-containing protein [Candidatus Gottesmanbacteria bacterium]
MYPLTTLINTSLQNVQKTVGIIVVFLSTMISIPIDKQIYMQNIASSSGEISNYQPTVRTPTVSPQQKKPQIVEVTPLPGSNRPTLTMTPQQQKPESETGVVLRNITPSSTNFGDTVTLNGQNFGNDSGKIWFSNTRGINWSVNIDRWSDTQVVVTVPNFLGGQKVNVLVETTGKKQSNPIEIFIIEGQPVISSMTPPKPIIGGQLIVKGLGFGTASGAVNIYEATNVNSPLVTCQITHWSETEITCTVPNESLVNKEYGIQVITGSNRKSSWVYATFLCDPNGCG